MKRCALGSLLCLCVCFYPAIAQQPQKPLAVEKAPKLPSSIEAKFERQKSVADKIASQKKFSEAIPAYWSAYDLLPEPKQNLLQTTSVLAAIGEANFAVGDYEACRDNLSAAMHSPGAIGTPSIHLRLGACQYELGNMARAADELARAYIPVGKSVFREGDQKYLAFIKTKLLPPPGGWPNGW